jgi:hypothetical protein
MTATLVIPTLATVLGNIIFVLVAAVAIGLVAVPIIVSARRRAAEERARRHPS